MTTFRSLRTFALLFGSLPLDFLGQRRFEAELYLDEPTKGPTAVTRRTEKASAAAPLRVVMPRAGGFVGRLTPAAR